MSETTQKPRAYMRRWAYDGIDVMRLKPDDRPRGWTYLEVTLTQLFPDDVPLYSLEPKEKKS